MALRTFRASKARNQTINLLVVISRSRIRTRTSFDNSICSERRTQPRCRQRSTTQVAKATANSQRAICKDEDVPGSHERSSTRHPTRGFANRVATRHPTRARTSARAEGKACAARRVLIADRCSLIPGFRAQERSASSFPSRNACTRAGNVRSTEISTRRSWSRCHADFTRAPCAHDAACEGAAPRPLSASSAGTGSKLIWQSARLLTGRCWFESSRSRRSDLW